MLMATDCLGTERATSVDFLGYRETKVPTISRCIKSFVQFGKERIRESNICVSWIFMFPGRKQNAKEKHQYSIHALNPLISPHLSPSIKANEEKAWKAGERENNVSALKDSTLRSQIPHRQ